jgi:hypothetical protein
LGRLIQNAWLRLDIRKGEGNSGHEQYLDSGDLASGEPLLVGVDQSSATARYPMNRMHGKVEESAANSPRCFLATGIDRGGRAASNGGRRSSTPKDGAKSLKQIKKEKEEGLGNFQTATQNPYTSLRRR